MSTFKFGSEKQYKTNLIKDQQKMLRPYWGLPFRWASLEQIQTKAFVEVNEEGTEAAAATAVAMELNSLPIAEPFIPTFKADRPFIYFIKDNDSGTILFLGRMNNPTL